MRWTDWFWTLLGLVGLSTLAWSLYWPVAKTKNVQVARRAEGPAIASKWQPRHLGPERRRLRYSAKAALRHHSCDSCTAMFTASMHSDLPSASSFAQAPEHCWLRS
jgi:hypothetical protein